MKICSKCILPETYPGIEFDEQGVCNFCSQSITKEKESAKKHFTNEQELLGCLMKYKNLKGTKYDVLVPLSGGVDSSNAFITIVKTFKLKALGFHNDNGYEDKIALDNVRNLCKALNVDLVITQQGFSFMKKLYKYINEANVKGITSCYICGNILYMNALEIADRFDIPLIINGYSKGQAAQINDEDKGHEMLEKIVAIIEKTGDKEFFHEFIGKYDILKKRLIFKDKKDLEKDITPGKILIIPFYLFKFYKMDKETLKQRVLETCDWKSMKTGYPGRTTNCNMIWLNTYADLQKMGYSSYTIEYAELIRNGEITRNQALCDLEFNPPHGMLEKLANDIGLDLNKIPIAEDIEEKLNDKRLDIDFDF
jgi:hypothetical protein